MKLGAMLKPMMVNLVDTAERQGFVRSTDRFFYESYCKTLGREPKDLPVRD